ncbi:MAG: hypothetical protein IJ766_03560 [Clostridia bacterium]|nr:hypothetical protein [Clostridia bacterium]
MKKFIALFLSVCTAALLFTACKTNKTPEEDLNVYATTAKHTQNFIGTEPGATAGNPGGTPILIDNSWTSNYTLTYEFTENGEMSTLTERRCAGMYSVTDAGSGITSYFIQDGDNIDQYVLNPADNTGTHAVLNGQNLADVPTGFMKIAYVSPAFTTYANVEYQSADSVADRPAQKYNQSAYNDAGLLTAYAFVWLDSAYGFASKCQVYNLTGNINTGWELKSLTVGGVSAESIGFSTDGYTITEAEG